MNSDRQQAYLNLIDRLLNSPSGEEAQILQNHPELLDDGLVTAMLEEADNLREQGELNSADWLKNFAGLLGKVDGDFLAGITLKAEADRLFEQGNRQNNISKFREALQSWEQALTIYREIGSHQGEAASLGSLGDSYDSLGQYHRAIEFLEKSLEILREIGDRPGEAISLNKLGNAYYSLGQYRRAIEFHQQSLEIQRAIGSCQGKAISLGSLGNAYYSLGQYQKAIEFQQQSLEISREIGDRRGEAISLGSLGNAYYSLGQYQKAIEFHQQSLEISREIGNRQGEASSLGNLCNAYYSLGQYQRTIEFQQQSLEISREIGDRQGEANSLGNLGGAYNSLGQDQQAIKFYQQSLEIQRAIGDRQGEATSLGSLGSFYHSLGQYQGAIEFHQQSLEIEREIRDRRGEAASLGNLGLAYQYLGQFQRAMEFHQQSLEIEREIGNRSGEATSLHHLGDAYYDISYVIRMRYESLPKIITFFVKKIFIFGEKFWLEQAETALCASIAIHETLRSELVKDDQKISFFETQVSAYQNLQKVLVTQSKFDEALEISEMSRTRAFVELLRQTLLTNELPTNNETNKLSIPKIQQIVRDKNSTIVEYSIVYPEIYIWVIQPNGNITHRAANLEPLNQQNQTLKQIILQTRISIGSEETDDAGNKIKLESAYKRDETGGFPLLKLLHQILIEPIIDLLPTDANSPIVFIPHYDLFLLPFAALQDSNNRYLIEDRTILTAPSIQVLETTGQHLQQIRGLRQVALIVGDPKISSKFQENPYKLRQLPRAKEAAETIAQILNTQPISGENATKAAILDRMLNTRIVHLSAHGLLDDFQGSGIPGAIILAPSSDADDGAIYAGEILQLKLNSELVVLSACSTGCGKITGDGVIGLSRCFILAGVPSIIVSLWNTGAISAKLLMTEFYQNLAKGENRAAALRRAMLTTKAEFPSPIAWAAFTLIGETESLSLETEEVDLRRLKMSLPDDIKPEEIVAGLNKLLQISEPKLFAEHLGDLAIDPKDNVEIAAQKIREWCESRSQLEENLENEIYQLGAGGTDSDVSEEIVNELMETIQENVIRLGLSRQSISEVETEDNSGTESVDNPTEIP